MDNKMIIDWPQTIINDRFFCIQFRNALDYSAVAIFGNLKKSGYNRCCITLLGYHFLSIFINYSTHKNDLTNAFELITVAGRLVFFFSLVDDEEHNKRRQQANVLAQAQAHAFVLTNFWLI